MTIWSAPDVAYLLDDHLKQARLELLADHRLRLNVEDNDGEDPGFVAELIVDKLEAAARAGFDAVEASLRAAAAQYLGEKALPVHAVRETVAEACKRIVPPARPRLEKVDPSIIPPSVIGGLFATALLILSFTLWAQALIGGVLYAVAALISVGVGVGVTKLINANAARRRAQLINEWPARVCRHYTSTLREGTAYYEHVIRTFARGGTFIPWR